MTSRVLAYQVRVEVLSCQDRDPEDNTMILDGNGVILEVTVVSRTKMDGPGAYDWWPAPGKLPQKMRVFHDTDRKASCTAFAPGTKLRGKMRYLCCDGGEPRCEFGLSVYAYDLKR